MRDIGSTPEGKKVLEDLESLSLAALSMPVNLPGTSYNKGLKVRASEVLVATIILMFVAFSTGATHFNNLQSRDKTNTFSFTRLIRTDGSGMVRLQPQKIHSRFNVYKNDFLLFA